MEEKTELDVANKKVVKVDVKYGHLDEGINRALTDKRCADVNVFLGQLFNALDIGRNVKKVIAPNLNYVVKFTPELLKKMEEHDIQFLRDKLTGELLPDLYDYTEKGIGGKIRLEIQGRPTGQDVTNLSNSMNNLIEQQRYEALAEEIQHLHIIAKRIERGQDNDRFAKVNAGRKHLLDALNYQGTEEEKKKFVLDALAMLRDGYEIIERTLIDKLDALEEIPESKIKRLWICFWQPDYFDKQTGRYGDIQEYFQYYYMSIQPMACAYTYLGQPQLIEGLLEDSRKVFEHDKIGYLSTVEYLLPDGKFDGIWYKSSKIHEQKLLESYKEREKDEDLYIIVKGCEILEVLGNDETE